MEDKKYRAIKARIAYREYVDGLPKCRGCSQCIEFFNRNKKSKMCIAERRLIEGRVKTSPLWCPLR